MTKAEFQTPKPVPRSESETIIRPASYWESLEYGTLSVFDRVFPPHPDPQGEHVSSVMVGMARCAVPARVVAGGTNDRAALALERVAPLHAARTSQRDVQRDVPTTLNTYQGEGRGEGEPSVTQ